MQTFRAVYERHVHQIFGFFAYRLGSRETAEDLTQITFERALRAWERYDPRRAGHATWLHAIARNALIDHLRADRSRRLRPLGPEAESVGADAEPHLGLAPELEQALTTLGERERELIALRFGGDLTGPEIAALTGLSLANVQQILSRALRRLRAELEAGAAAPQG